MSAIEIVGLVLGCVVAYAAMIGVTCAVVERKRDWDEAIFLAAFWPFVWLVILPYEVAHHASTSKSSTVKAKVIK